MVAFADDVTSAWRLAKLRSWWKDLWDVGPKCGYFAKPIKTISIAKLEYMSKTAEIFDNTNMKITSQRHLSLVIGSEQYRKKYIEEIVSNWRDELLLLSRIAEIKPQVAYTLQKRSLLLRIFFGKCD